MNETNPLLFIPDVKSALGYARDYHAKGNLDGALGDLLQAMSLLCETTERLYHDTHADKQPGTERTELDQLCMEKALEEKLKRTEAACAGMRRVLQRLDAQGGLGLDEHNRIREALQSGAGQYHLDQLEHFKSKAAYFNNWLESVRKYLRALAADEERGSLMRRAAGDKDQENYRAGCANTAKELISFIEKHAPNL